MLRLCLRGSGAMAAVHRLGRLGVVLEYKLRPVLSILLPVVQLLLLVLGLAGWGSVFGLAWRHTTLNPKP